MNAYETQQAKHKRRNSKALVHVWSTDHAKFRLVASYDYRGDAECYIVERQGHDSLGGETWSHYAGIHRGEDRKAETEKLDFVIARELEAALSRGDHLVGELAKAANSK